MSYHFEWSVLWTYRDDLLRGILMTVALSLAAIAVGMALGTLVGIMRTTAVVLFRDLGYLFVEIMRNIPVIVKVFFLYFGVGLDAFSATLIGLTLHQSAYIAESVRAGIRSIPAGQFEMALASGLTAGQALRLVILPQAVRIVLPPLASNFIEIIKNSSVGVTVGLMELTYQAKMINAETFRGFEAATAVTVLYLLMTLVVPLVLRLLQSRLRYEI